MRPPPPGARRPPAAAAARVAAAAAALAAGARAVGAPPEAEAPSAAALSWPRGQAPSAAQDALACGLLLLPERVGLAQRTIGWFERSGAWLSDDGATLASWTIETMRVHPENVYYSRGPQGLFKSEHGVADGTIALQDCQGVRLFGLRPQAGRYEYDLLDRKGALLARSRFGQSRYFPEQVLFSDPDDQPIAVASSPLIVHPPTHGFTTQPHQEEPADWVPRWEVHFYDAGSTNSTLIQAQQRWAVAAAVQEMALGDARARDASLDRRAWFAAACAAAAVAALASALALHCGVHALVYPPTWDEAGEGAGWLEKGAAAYGATTPRAAGRARR